MKHRNHVIQNAEILRKSGPHIKTRKAERSADYEIQEFFEDLASRQRPMDGEIAKILHENLWELYD